jgi:hypothetical protein
MCKYANVKMCELVTINIQQTLIIFLCRVMLNF